MGKEELDLTDDAVRAVDTVTNGKVRRPESLFARLVELNRECCRSLDLEMVGATWRNVEGFAGPNAVLRRLVFEHEGHDTRVHN